MLARAHPNRPPYSIAARASWSARSACCGELGRPAQRLSCLVSAARPAQDLAEGEQQLAGAVGVAGSRRLEHVQRAGVVLRRLLVAVLRRGPVAGALRVVDRLPPPRRARPRGSGARARSGAVPGCRRRGPRAPRRPRGAGAPAAGREGPRRARRGRGCARSAGARSPRGPRPRARRRRPRRGRRRARPRPARSTRPITSGSNSRPTTDASASTSRHRSVCRCRRRPIASRTPCGIGSRPGAVSPSAASRRPISWANSGLPCGLGVDLGRQLVGGRVAHRQGQEARRVRSVEPAQRDPLHRGLARERRPASRPAPVRPRCRGSSRRSGSARRRAGRPRSAGAAARARRPRAGRRGRRRAARRRPRCAGTPRPTPAGGSARPRTRPARDSGRSGMQVPQLGEDGGQLGPGRRAVRAARPARCRGCRPAAPGPRASRRGRRRPPSSARRTPALRAAGRGRPSSSASRLLPIPGSPADEREPPAAGQRIVERAHERGELALAAHERAARRRRAAGSARRGAVEARGPGAGWPARARAARDRARCRARRRGRGARPGRRRARRPGGPTGRARA